MKMLGCNPCKPPFRHSGQHFEDHILPHSLLQHASTIPADSIAAFPCLQHPSNSFATPDNILYTLRDPTVLRNCIPECYIQPSDARLSRGAKSSEGNITCPGRSARDEGRVFEGGHYEA